MIDAFTLSIMVGIVEGFSLFAGLALKANPRVPYASVNDCTHTVGNSISTIVCSPLLRPATPVIKPGEQPERGTHRGGLLGPLATKPIKPNKGSWIASFSVFGLIPLSILVWDWIYGQSATEQEDYYPLQLVTM